MLVEANTKPRTSAPALQAEETPGSSETAPQKGGSTWLLVVILCALAVLVGLPSLQGKFLADDFTWLNLLCTKPQEVLFSGLHGRYMYYPIFGEHYRPLLSIPFLADALLFGANATMLHLSNLLWHTACTVLVFFVGKILCQSFPIGRISLSELRSSSHANIQEMDSNASLGDDLGGRDGRAPYKKKESLQAIQTAFWAAAIFAVHPFHCENIGWWTAKNDIVYSFFYLLSLNFFLDRKSGHRPLAYIAFVIALCCKETALTLPFLLSAQVFLKNAFENRMNSTKPTLSRFVENLVISLSSTKTFFALLAGFWLLRTICLGQIGGSYYGTLTNLWFEKFGERFGNLTKDSILWYPVDFNDGVFSQVMLLLFGAVYLIFIAATVFSWMRTSEQKAEGNRSSDLPSESSSKIRWQDVGDPVQNRAKSFNSMLSFIAVFAVLTLIPACLIWSPNTSLEGTRLLYLFTVPLSLFCSVAINGPLLKNVAPAFRAGLLIALIALLSASCIQSHLRWAYASSFCTTLSQRIEFEARNLLRNQKLFLFDLPRVVRGVSIVHYHSILQDSLRPPFFDGAMAEKVAAFEPHYFGEHDRINAHLRTMLGDGNAKLLYFLPSADVAMGSLFDPPRSTDVRIEELTSAQLEGGNLLSFNKTFKATEGNKSSGRGLSLRNFPIQLDCLVNGADYGIVRLHLTNTGGAEKLKFKISWKSAESNSFDKEHSKFFHEPYEKENRSEFSKSTGRSITVNLGTTITWLKENDIDAVLVTLMSDGPRLESLELLDGRTVLPQIAPANSARIEAGKPPALPGSDKSLYNEFANDGTLRSKNGKFKLTYDASSITGCTAVLVEVAPALIDFMDINGKQLDLEKCPKAVRKFVVHGAKSPFEIDGRLGSPVWHQIRVRPLDRNSKPVGYASEPLYLQSLSERSLPVSSETNTDDSSGGPAK